MILIMMNAVPADYLQRLMLTGVLGHNNHDAQVHGCSAPRHSFAVCTPADYVQRFARPETMMGRNGNNNHSARGKDSEDGEDQKMNGGAEEKGHESEGFLSSSSDEES